ncbi:tyrosine-type recombinase/integrase [Paenibacillus qinlingensis]|uniref:tyrosine-type recombinase/integrase n=1 Tax=Paenibacillus qinlingensis TaxID=1837343 RepID=UPI00236835E3|nr:site-specific integrase [Paenibacillus qinlingensis]
MRIGNRNDKREGRKQLFDRQPLPDVNLPSYTLKEAVDYVMKIKRANNLKERTLRGYIENMDYFIEWVNAKYGEVSVQDVTATVMRDYVLWCAKEKGYYEGHPFKSEFSKDKVGLAASSVNVRIRVLRTFFNILYSEEVIDRNPALNLSLMRQDVDTVEPLTEDELKRLLRAPDQKSYAQWRDYIALILILDSGMRLNEICSLEKSEIDFVKKQIILPAIKNRIVNLESYLFPLRRFDYYDNLLQSLKSTSRVGSFSIRIMVNN